MSMTRIQLQLGRSMPKFFQQFGIEHPCTAILKKLFEPQGFNCLYGSEIALWFVQDCLHSICPHSFSRRFDKILHERLLVRVLVTRARTDGWLDWAEFSR